MQIRAEGDCNWESTTKEGPKHLVMCVFWVKDIIQFMISGYFPQNIRYNNVI